VCASQAGFKQADAKAQYAAKLRPNLLSAFEEAAPSNAPKEPVDKVDMADINDAQAVVPYLQEIHRHYREAEVSTSIRCRAHAPSGVGCRQLHYCPASQMQRAASPLLLEAKPSHSPTPAAVRTCNRASTSHPPPS
jgi:hypothetical protein